MHCLPRRSLAALALCALALPALAQGPITLIVGWPAGGPSDNVARLAATRMSEAASQSVGDGVHVVLKSMSCSMALIFPL